MGSGVCIRAYRDLSQPEAWHYWKDQYVSPSLTFSLIDKVDLDGAADVGALFVSGTIGRLRLRDRLDQANLAPATSSAGLPGGDLNQGGSWGEIILLTRARDRGECRRLGPGGSRLIAPVPRLSGLCRGHSIGPGLGIGRSSVCHNQGP